MTTNPLPRHNIGAICSQVSFDKVTHAVHLLNIQNVFQTPTLPATLSQFVVANNGLIHKEHLYNSLRYIHQPDRYLQKERINSL